MESFIEFVMSFHLLDCRLDIPLREHGDSARYYYGLINWVRYATWELLIVPK